MMMQSFKKREGKRGFTLIEIMVSLSVFIIVMTISLGSILSILNSSEKSQTKKTAMDNLNFALESMSRTIRFGTNFYCGTTNPPPVADCGAGDSTFSVRDSNGNLVVYSLSGGKIMKAVNGAAANAVTSSEITITRLTFYVFGSSAFPDINQPRVIISLSGTVGAKTATQSSFNLETTISQRKLDI